ncbi:MAG TPA: phosphoenolpyruvate synthase [Candidatus Pacearchaeota archaeon]|nr:phosphoenolpyruvate synthase [Candidatus Pacearchaeota archaeon]
MSKNIMFFSEIRKKDVPIVGGKNASLGEMYTQLTQKGINIPNGFATTADAYKYFLSYNGIDKKIAEIFAKIDLNKLEDVQKAGKLCRNLTMKSKFPDDLRREIIEAYEKLCEEYGEDTDVAVRSSATAEDLPDASFAGQHESYLNIKGNENVLEAVKSCYASLFMDRAIAYRRDKGFDQLSIYLSAVIQKMVRSDIGSSGVMFTLDTDSGFDKVVLINSIWGVGELIVKGRITPDKFFIFKPTGAIINKEMGRKNRKMIYRESGGIKEVDTTKEEKEKYAITDEEALTLAKWGCIIEEHYQSPQDIEWAKDGKTGELFIVQSRPETVHSLKDKEKRTYKEYTVDSVAKPIITGISIGDKVSKGVVRVITDVKKMGDFKKGEILVTKMTDPDWNAILTMSSAVITDEGGKTCHSAIISRELGIPAIVGTKDATKKLKTGDIVTVDCSSGQIGRVLEGDVPFSVKEYNLEEMPQINTKITLNIGAPDTAFKASFLPNDGVGLAREEFIIAEKVRIHPMALIDYDNVLLTKEEREIADDLTREYSDKKEYFIYELAEGIAQIAAAFYPKKVIVRFSDFKTNEYRNLIGGRLFEGEESNPMLGFRGACRYIDKSFQPAFEMECKAIKRVREVFGLTNVCVMVPFCRTVEEGKQVVDLIREFGLNDDMPVYVMCEIPSNVILAEQFLEIFDGMSIGSNDLTQLTLGLDRDNGGLAHIGNENNEAVKKLIRRVIKICKEKNKYCGICGQAPSDYPEFAKFLAEEGIESISLNADTVIKTIMELGK